MKRYLKIGLFSFALLMIGVIVGSGAIGDMIRSTLAGASAEAERSEVEDRRQTLANEFADKIGQPLGAENEQISLSSAMRCKALSQVISLFGQSYTDFSEEQLATIEANANAIIYNRAALEGKDELQISSEINLMRVGYSEKSAQDNPRRWRVAAIELKNVCSPLLGQMGGSK